MRIRSTKPEFWRSKTIAALPWDVRFVLKGLESYVDDNGVGKDDIALIAADVFPRDLSASPRETLARLSEAISDLSEAGLIVRYEIDGEDLIYVDRWKDIQRIDKPARGRFRRPDGTLEYIEDVSRESYAKPREDVARAPEVLAPGTGEQGNRGTELSSDESDETDTSPTFADFYDAYPRKEARRKAEGAWRAALKRASAETIMDGLRRFDFSGDRQFVPLPASWLNADRWADQPTAPRLVAADGKRSWSTAELEALLGPDYWRCPQPPGELSPDQMWEWEQQIKREHRAERVRQAEAKQGQAS